VENIKIITCRGVAQQAKTEREHQRRVSLTNSSLSQRRPEGRRFLLWMTRSVPNLHKVRIAILLRKVKVGVDESVVNHGPFEGWRMADR
jgi:hypothetical protein